MKILTLNCHSWFEQDQFKKIEILINNIIEEDYDIICFQECNQYIKDEVVYDDIKTSNFGYIILKKLEELQSIYSYQWEKVKILEDRIEEGVAILTKFKIKSKDSYYITNSDDLYLWKVRKLFKTIVEYKEKDIAVYCCHMGWWDDKEEPFSKQAEMLLKDISEFKGVSIVAGDFNNPANIEGQGYSLLIESLYDSYSLAKQKDDGITVSGNITGWEKNKKDIRIDLVLFNQPLDVITSEVIFNGKNKPIISDHFGVKVEFIL